AGNRSRGHRRELRAGGHEWPASCSQRRVNTATASFPDTRMTAGERRASGSLAAIFAARMLGLFLVLPVFALEALRYPGGGDPAVVGVAMGIDGLPHGLLQ